MRTDSLKDFVMDQLRGVSGLECRSMFGGFGLYAGEKFFGIIFEGRLYFKTNEATRVAFVERGMKPFRPGPKQKLSSYFEVPADVIEETGELEKWAGDAIRTKAK